MIDLHAHVLPGIDDGPPDLVGAVAMLDAAAADGTRTILATPHIRPDYPAVVPGELARRVAEVNAAAERHGLAIRVLPGGEVDIGLGLELSDADLRRVTLGGDGGTLLVETPHGPLPPRFELLVGVLRDRGYRILLAHPELNRELRDDRARVEALVADGVMLQVTSRSLREPRRSAARRAALDWLAAGLVHAIASDAHRATWRPPLLGSDVAAVRESRPELAAALDAAAIAGPEAILAGRTPETVRVAAQAGRPGLSLLRHVRRRG